MQKLLRVISVILITIMVTSPPAFSGGGFSNSGSSSGGVALDSDNDQINFDPDDDGLPETVMNSDGSMNVGGPENSTGGDYSKTVYDLGVGKITNKAFGQTNNESLTDDYESDANMVTTKSATGVTNHTYDGVSLGTTEQFISGAIPFSVTSALVAQYNMEENAANTTVDNAEGTAARDCTASTNTSNLTTTGKLGSGFNFVAASSESLDCGSDSSLKFSADFMVEGWFKTSTAGTTKIITGNRSSSGSNNGYNIYTGTTNFLTLLVDAGTNTSANIVGTTTVTDGNWHHFAVGRKGSTLLMYVDGVAEGAVTGSVPQAMSSTGNTQIGRSPQSASFFNGDIDTLRYYSRALTANEVSALFNNGIGTISSSRSFGANPGSYYFGSGGGKIMVEDTDNAGCTVITALNGTVSGATDADCII